MLSKSSHIFCAQLDLSKVMSKISHMCVPSRLCHNSVKNLAYVVRIWICQNSAKNISHICVPNRLFRILSKISHILCPGGCDRILSKKLRPVAKQHHHHQHHHHHHHHRSQHSALRNVHYTQKALKSLSPSSSSKPASSTTTKAAFSYF